MILKVKYSVSYKRLNGASRWTHVHDVDDLFNIFNYVDTLVREFSEVTIAIKIEKHILYTNSGRYTTEKVCTWRAYNGKKTKVDMELYEHEKR